MIEMDMSKQQSVNPFIRSAQYLLAEIRTAVNQQRNSSDAHNGGRAQALVMRIRRTAHFAIATNLRHSGRCAST
jgi:hypothetical protein